MALAGAQLTIAGLLVGVAPRPAFDGRTIGLTLTLALAAAIASYFPIRGPEHFHTLNPVFLVAAAALLEPLPAVTIAAAVVASDVLRRGWRPYPFLFNLGNLSLAVSVPAAINTAGATGAFGARQTVPALVAFAAFAALNLPLNTLAVSIGRKQPVRSVFRASALRIEVLVASVGVPVAVVLDTAPLLLPFAIAPLIFAHKVLRIPELERDSQTDSKTGLLNMRAFHSKLTSELARAYKVGEPLCLLALDMDHFRDLNNTQGHGAADRMIEFVGSTIAGHVRAGDVAARFGGDEFIVLLPATELPSAVEVGERIRAAVDDSVVMLSEAGRIRTSVSVGAVQAKPEDSTDAALERADRALYRAKALGRNRVATDELPHPDDHHAALAS